VDLAGCDPDGSAMGARGEKQPFAPFRGSFSEVRTSNKIHPSPTDQNEQPGRYRRCRISGLYSKAWIVDGMARRNDPAHETSGRFGVLLRASIMEVDLWQV
jgi:hypothetical protein